VFHKPYKIQIKPNTESDAANAILIYTEAQKPKKAQDVEFTLVTKPKD